MGRRAGLVASAALVGALAWLPLTSAALHLKLRWTTPPTFFGPFMPAPAYFYWRDFGSHPDIRRWLPPCAFGSGLALLAPVAIGLFVRPRRRLLPGQPGEPVPEPERARSSTHGSAYWMRAGEVQRWYPGAAAHGGVVIGQLGEGGEAPLLVDPCEDAHGFVVGGTGTGKTASVTVPTMDPTVGWRSSVVVFDPSCEVAAMTAGMRIAAGQRVVTLAPGRQGMDVLGWIDPSDPEATAHVDSMVDMIGKERPEHSSADPMWQGSAKAILFVILAHMLWDTTLPRAEKTLKRFARMVAIPEQEMRAFLGQIHLESECEQARIIAGTLMEAPDKTFGGFYRSAQVDVRWLLTTTYADMVSGSDLDAAALADGQTTVYVQIPMATLQNTPEVGRTIVNALLEGVYRRNGRVRGRVLFLLDEVNLLGKMTALAVARDNARKYRIALVPMWQSLGQITDTWGVGGKRNWMGASAWQWFAGVNDEHTAKEVSDRCGTFTGLARSESTSHGSSGGMQGSRNRNQSAGLSEVAVPLIRPDEVVKLARSERLIFRTGAPPLRCQAAWWFKRPAMATRIGV